jgi:hypothetical protein
MKSFMQLLKNGEKIHPQEVPLDNLQLFANHHEAGIALPVLTIFSTN